MEGSKAPGTVAAAAIRRAPKPHHIDIGTARLAFWVGFPIVLGLFSGSNQIGMIAPALTMAWSFIYWLVLAALMWIGMGIGTAALGFAARRLPYVVTLTAGGLLGIALVRPVHAAYQRLFLPLTADPAQIATLPPLPATLFDWQQLFLGNALLLVFWVGGALFFSAFIGYRPLVAGAAETARSIDIDDAPASAPNAAAPQFAARLEKLRFDALEAIVAEDHYVRCLAAEGEELMLYRFADAITELAPFGWTRIHRSACVRCDRVADFVQIKRNLTLTLHSGRSLAVSGRYQALVLSLLRP